MIPPARREGSHLRVCPILRNGTCRAWRNEATSVQLAGDFINLEPGCLILVIPFSHIWNRAVRLTDQAALSSLADAIADWEPSLHLTVPPEDAVLYEADGTLYGIWLGMETTFQVHQRHFQVRRGDALVIPGALAVDAGPDVRMLAVRHEGDPPDHFRERFIQVWGVDHRPAPDSNFSRGRYDVIPGDELRLRLTYSLIEPDPGEAVEWSADPDPVLVVGLTGGSRLNLTGLDGCSDVSLEPGSLCLLAPGTSGRIRGEGRLGFLVCESDLRYQARRGGRPGGATSSNPEYLQEQ